MTEGKVYLKNKIEAMNNDERIEFIYFKLVECLKQARFAIKRDSIEDRVNKINKSIEIITTLISILDMDAGGEIAIRFQSIYSYSIDRLSQANLKNDPGIINEMIKIYEDLHFTWRKKINQDRQQTTPQHFKNQPVKSVSEEEPAAYSDSKSGLELYG